MINVLEDFVIALGFQVQLNQLAEFQRRIAQAQNAVAQATSHLTNLFQGTAKQATGPATGLLNMAKAALKAQGATAGATAQAKANAAQGLQQAAALEGVAGKFDAVASAMKKGLDVSIGIVKGFVEAQVAIVGFFAAIGMAALGFADKLAEADQENRLFANSMFLTQKAGREMKAALDALGEPLEAIQWDKELSDRFNILIQDQERLNKGLGPDFEQQIKRVRDVSFEFKRLRLELGYLGNAVLANLIRLFGPAFDAALNKLRELNDWLIKNLGPLSEWIARELGPILNDTWDVLKETGELVIETFKDLSVLFSNIVGVLSGNDAIQGTEFKFQNLATAVRTVIHWLAEFVHAMTDFEHVVLHWADAIVFALGAVGEAFKGNFSEAGKYLEKAGAEFHEGMKTLGPGAGGIMGAIGGGGAGALTGAGLFGMAGTAIGGATMGPLGAAILGPLGASIGGALLGTGGAVGGGLLGSWAAGKNSEYEPRQQGGPMAGLPGHAQFSKAVEGYTDLINKAAADNGIDPLFLKSIMQAESSGRNLGPNAKGATGLMQLLPATARDLGVTDIQDPTQNVEGGAKYLRQLMDRYHGDMDKVTEAYNFGLGNVDRGAALPKETIDYLARVKQLYSAAYQEQQGRAATSTATSGPASSSMTIGQVNVHVTNPQASKEEIYTASAQAMQDELSRHSRLEYQRDIAQMH